MGLKIKISAGYLMLILLLAFVIYLFHGEGVKRNTLKEEESTLADIRSLTAEAYMSFLDLSSRAEVAGIWTENDFNAYCGKQDSIRENLKALKHYIHAPEQLARIDSFNHLLDEKRKLLAVIMNIFDESADVSELVNEKIPVIVSHVRKAQSIPQTKEDERPKPEKKKKNIFWNIFHKKETKSAYLQHREQGVSGKAEVKNVVPAVTIPLLHSLHREVTEKQKERQTRLFRQMDSLYENSQTLNRKLNTLIGDFEKEAASHLSSTYEVLITSREESFYIVSGLAAFVFILAIGLYIIVHKDINRRYGYEKALELSDRKNKDLLQSKKNMMLTIAHDLRAPLATIKGCAELLPGEKRESLQNGYAENILHTSDYMLGLINTLIEYYMLDTDRLKLNTTVFPLDRLFKEIAGTFTSLARKKNLSLSTTFAGLETMVYGDRQHIQQIINNLLSNAIKFTGQGGIQLDAEYDNQELYFSVRDTGPGITTGEKERIFNAFERLDNARDTSGFGLGLPICAKLVSGMGGIITVESQPGKGSTFMVFLPLPQADAYSWTEEAQPADYPYFEGMHVLVIDDDRIQLNVTRDMLNRSGIKCDCCQTSHELISLLRKQEYDLLLTDIQMPETNGYEILELLRCSNIESAKQIPVLAVTAQIEDENVYLSRGFSGCVHKPFLMNELMDVIARNAGKTDKKRYDPDFTFILSEEEDKGEMLDLFITESRKDLANLTDALEKRNRKAAIAILHKNLPLWESVRLDFPLSHLRELVICDIDKWTDGQIADLWEIIHAVERLIEYAVKLRKEAV